MDLLAAMLVRFEKLVVHLKRTDLGKRMMPVETTF